MRVLPVVAGCVLLLLGACSATGGSAPEANVSATVPLKVLTAPNAAIAVLPVSIDGHGPFPFALDTGASTSLMDTRTARKIGLAVHGNHSAAGVACTTHVHEATIRHWSTGSLHLPADTVAVTDLAAGRKGGLVGLLGSDVLGEYGTITVDYAAGRLRLGKAAGEHASRTTKVSLKIDRAQSGATLVLAPVKVDGHGPYRFVLDTGAETSTLGLQVARKIRIRRTASHKKVTGVACSTQVQRARLRHWAVGRRQLPSSRVDVLRFADAKGGSRLQGLLGSDVLSEFGRITIDYRAGTLVLPAARRSAIQMH